MPALVRALGSQRHFFARWLHARKSNDPSDMNAHNQRHSGQSRRETDPPFLTEGENQTAFCSRGVASLQRLLRTSDVD
jgi:hypothetical protein